MAEKHNMLFLEVSAKSGSNVEETFTNLTKEIKNNRAACPIDEDTINLKAREDPANKKQCACWYYTIILILDSLHPIKWFRRSREMQLNLFFYPPSYHQARPTWLSPPLIIQHNTGQEGSLDHHHHKCILARCQWMRVWFGLLSFNAKEYKTKATLIVF